MLSTANPKVKPGQLSRAEAKQQKQLARLSGVKGPTATRRAQKARSVALGEAKAKRVVRARDRVCRWPGCDCGKLYGQWSALECAHLDDKGAGGDPQLIRSVPDRMILVCRWNHTGPFGLHSGRARIEALTPTGTSGPCAFYRRAVSGVPEFLVGESSPGGADA